MAHDLLFVAEFHQVPVIKAINIIRDNRDFIASLVILPVQPDIPTSIRAEHRGTSTADPLQCRALQFRCVVDIQVYA